MEQPPGIIYGISPKNSDFKVKNRLCRLKILMPKSSSGDLCWVENQYVLVNMYLKRVKKKKNEYSPHNVSILWDLKNYFVCRQICWNPWALALILCTIQNGPATSSLLFQLTDVIQFNFIWHSYLYECSIGWSYTSHIQESFQRINMYLEGKKRWTERITVKSIWHLNRQIAN